MNQSTRRQFLVNVAAGLGTANLAGGMASSAKPGMAPANPERDPNAVSESRNFEIDFRYSPLASQLTYCFPDDHQKSLMGEDGELRFGHPGLGWGIDYFPEVVAFTLEGMEANRVRWQELEAPGVPVVHTRIDRPETFLELTTFATRREGEGRVDNVILEIAPRTLHDLHAVPLVILRTKREIKLTESAGATLLRLDSETAPPFMVSNVPLSLHEDGVVWRSYKLKTAFATEGKPSRCFFRFPQEGQDFEKVKEGLTAPENLLTEARQYWQNWKPFKGGISWQLPGRYGEFLVACARNIQQAREE